eukprot:g47737.t1
MGYHLSRHQPQCEPRPSHLKGRKQHRGPYLSETWSFADASCCRVNINTATEEELMTLQGISRTLAHNIVVYRHKIGGFRKVEDMALAPGVGAARLQQIRPEICVSSRGSSQSTGNLSSFDLLSSTQLNVNVASEKQLAASLGIAQDLAESIVHYRTLYGPFKRVDDLLQVDGVDVSLLGAIRSKLSVSLPRPVSSYSCTRLGDRPNQMSSYYSLQDLNLNHGVCDRFTSVRNPAEAFTGIFDGRKVIRIGTWNLQSLTLDKVNNPGSYISSDDFIQLVVRHGNGPFGPTWKIIPMSHENKVAPDHLFLGLSYWRYRRYCMKMLWKSILLINEICLELEKPTIATVQEWKGDRGKWKYVALDTSLGQEKR